MNHTTMAAVDTLPTVSRRLTEDAVSLYKYTVAHPAWQPSDVLDDIGLDEKRLAAAIGVLTSLRLFRASIDPPRGWDAYSPECAAAELLEAEEADLRFRQTQIRKMRGELSRLIPVYFEARQARRRAESIDIVRDRRVVRQLLSDWSRRVEQEVCVAHVGGGLGDDALAQSLEQDMHVLRRDVSIRTLLQQSVRHHPATRQYVTLVAEFGAEIRTVPVVPRTMIVFDRNTAFVPLEGGELDTGAAIVKDPSIVDFLFSIFEFLWTAGKPFVEEHPEYSEGRRDDVWRAILDHLAAGAKDDAIAHRLGLSVRTCRRHIAAIMEHLGASSRFQAGLLAYQRGLLDQTC